MNGVIFVNFVLRLRLIGFIISDGQLVYFQLFCRQFVQIVL